jgi:hypothetical protein
VIEESSWVWASLSVATVVGLNAYYWRRFVQFWRGDAFVLRGTARKPGEAEYERERDQHASMLLAVTLSTLGTVVAVAVWALDH